MSRQTKDKMEAAIREHFSDMSSGAYMTDYFVVATGPAATTDERAHAYVYEDGESPYHITYGLIMMAQDYITGAGEENETDL